MLQIGETRQESPARPRGSLERLDGQETFAHGSADPPYCGAPLQPANPHRAVERLAQADDQFDEDEAEVTQFRKAELKRYFLEHEAEDHRQGIGGNWRYLAGASICWFLLDYVFYGLGFNSPGTLSKLWTDRNVCITPDQDSWQLYCGESIFSALKWNAIEAIVTVSIWSIIGSSLITYQIRFINRKFTLIWTSILLGVVLLATAIVFPHAFHKPAHIVLIVLYAIIQFLFAYGPNTLLFIIPAEIFPTRYRCTCYGIAAAFGKLGAVAVQCTKLSFENGQLPLLNSPATGNLMYLFACFILLIAPIAWLCFPDPQEGGARERAETCLPCYTVENKSLESLGEGRTRQDRTGLVGRWRMIRRRDTGRTRAGLD